MFKLKEDINPIEIINAIRFCLGKDPLPETGKNRNKSNRGSEPEELHSEYFDVVNMLGLDK